MRYGDVRANETDYAGRIVIEVFCGGGWSVPAWEERGEPDFSGPFASIKDAERVIDDSCWNDAQ